MIILNSRKNLIAEVNAIKKYTTSSDTLTVLVYNLSLKNIFKATFYLLCGYRILWYKHEITTYSEKRVNNSILYSVVTIMLERFMHKISSRIATGNKKNAEANNFFYCPLLKIIDKSAANSDRDIDVLYFGRFDHRRSHSLFKQIEKLSLSSLKKGGEQYINDSEKREIFLRSKIVLNRYTKKISQSGVTSEALSYGCTVAVSEFDELHDKESENILFLKSKLTDEECIEIIKNKLRQKISFDDKEVSKLIGSQAFNKYWTNFLNV
tara:strand:+ start:106 stop:903 length:798 start_codon:yes stop_codon:yes gene_type:complete